jgi:hypothetical protein
MVGAWVQKINQNVVMPEHKVCIHFDDPTTAFKPILYYLQSVVPNEQKCYPCVIGELVWAWVSKSYQNVVAIYELRVLQAHKYAYTTVNKQWHVKPSYTRCKALLQVNSNVIQVLMESWCNLECRKSIKMSQSMNCEFWNGTSMHSLSRTSNGRRNYLKLGAKSCFKYTVMWSRFKSRVGASLSAENLSKCRNLWIASFEMAQVCIHFDEPAMACETILN